MRHSGTHTGEPEDTLAEAEAARLLAAVREAVGEVPPRLLTEVSNWPVPPGVALATEAPRDLWA